MKFVNECEVQESGAIGCLLGYNSDTLSVIFYIYKLSIGFTIEFGKKD